jgi:hypothetical protein
MLRTHQNVVRDPQVPSDAKKQVNVACPNGLFMETVVSPPEHEK